MQHHYLHYSIFIKKEEEAEENIVFKRKIREIIRWRLPFIMKKKNKKSICSLYDMLININNRYSLVLIGSPHKLLQKLIYYHVVTSIPRGGATQWLGGALAPAKKKKKKKFHQSRLKKNLGPPILDNQPPYAQFSTILPSPTQIFSQVQFQFQALSPYVLQIKQAGSLKSKH